MNRILWRDSPKYDIPEAVVNLWLIPTVDTYYRGRGRKYISLCSKHQRMLVRKIDEMMRECILKASPFVCHDEG